MCEMGSRKQKVKGAVVGLLVLVALAGAGYCARPGGAMKDQGSSRTAKTGMDELNAQTGIIVLESADRRHWIDLSSSDVNRITADCAIKAIVSSQEKGAEIQYESNNAYIKFVATKQEGVTRYREEPAEFFIKLDDGRVFNFIARPMRIPAVTVALGPTKFDAGGAIRRGF